jgi:hypothetical protein
MSSKTGVTSGRYNILLGITWYIASRLPEVRGRACAGAASASYASYRSDSICIKEPVIRKKITTAAKKQLCVQKNEYCRTITALGTTNHQKISSLFLESDARVVGDDGVRGKKIKIVYGPRIDV